MDAVKVLNGSSSIGGDDNNKEQQPVARSSIAAAESGNLTEQFVLLLLEQNLGPLRRNLDDFFLVLLALITFGIKKKK